MGLFEKAFKRLNETCTDSFEVIGDCLLVEEVPPEEAKTAGGIILHAQKKISQYDGIEANRPVFVKVLAVGNGYYDDTHPEKKDIPLETHPGDIILVGKLSVNWLSVFGPLVSSGESQLGITRESEIKLRFKGEAGYQKVCKTLIEFNGTSS